MGVLFRISPQYFPRPRYSGGGLGRGQICLPTRAQRTNLAYRIPTLNISKYLLDVPVASTIKSATG
jgi:hypothetical protein